MLHSSKTSDLEQELAVVLRNGCNLFVLDPMMDSFVRVCLSNDSAMSKWYYHYLSTSGSDVLRPFDIDHIDFSGTDESLPYVFVFPNFHDFRHLALAKYSESLVSGFGLTITRWRERAEMSESQYLLCLKEAIALLHLHLLDSDAKLDFRRINFRIVNPIFYQLDDRIKGRVCFIPYHVIEALGRYVAGLSPDLNVMPARSAGARDPIQKPTSGGTNSRKGPNHD